MAPSAASRTAPVPTVSTTREHVNELVRFFGDQHKRALRAENRGRLVSDLFDLPRRSVLGWLMKYENEATFLREVASVLTPEEVGRRMKVLGSRPYYLQWFLLFQDSFSARQQQLLERGLGIDDAYEDERLDDLLFIADFWERGSRSYRNDGALLPSPERDTQPILPPETVDAVETLLIPRADLDMQRLRRLLGTVEAYCFVAHGEQRDGIFGHGPYSTRTGGVLFFREFNDLRNDFLPWLHGTAKFACDNLVVGYECERVHVSCDMFGGFSTTPVDFEPQLRRIGVFTRREDELCRVHEEEWGELGETVLRATSEVFERIVEWPESFRTEYGAYLFANHTKPFMDLAGIDADERLLEAARETSRRHLERLIAGPSVPEIMRHWNETDGPLLWPIR
jgi:hypothetical protein